MSINHNAKIQIGFGCKNIFSYLTLIHRKIKFFSAVNSQVVEISIVIEFILAKPLDFIMGGYTPHMYAEEKFIRFCGGDIEDLKERKRIVFSVLLSL